MKLMLWLVCCDQVQMRADQGSVGVKIEALDRRNMQLIILSRCL